MSETPRRIQLSRKKGWKMPPNTVKVDRTTGFGNPYKAGDYLDKGPLAGTTIRDSAHAVEVFRAWVLEAMAGRAIPNDDGSIPTPDFVNQKLKTLRGKNLACWCRPPAPCHADVLLELANNDSLSHPDVIG